MEKSKFMFLDLFIFSILAGIAEFLSIFMFKIFSSGFYMSFSVMIIIISMVRWKYAGIAPAIVSGVVALILNQFKILSETPMTIPHGILYYVVANCFVILAIPFFHKNWKDAMNKKSNFVIFIVLSFVFIALGKGLMIFIINGALDGFLSYFTSTILTLVISLILLLLFKSKTDLVVNMDDYIKHVQEED